MASGFGARPERTEGWIRVLTEAKHEVAWCSGLSLAACFAVCLHYYFCPQYRKTPGWLLLRSTLWEALLSGLFLFIALGVHNWSDRHDQLLLLSLVSCEVAANAWRFVMSLHLLIVYRNPFNPERHRKKYHMLVLGCIAASAILCQFIDNRVGAGDDLIVFEVGFYFVPFALHTVVGAAVHCTVKMMIRTRQQESNHAISFLSRERAMGTNEISLMLHGFMHIVGLLVILVHQSFPDIFGGNGTKLWNWRVLVYPTCLRPSASLIGWFWVNSTLRSSVAFAATFLRRPAARQQLPLPRVDPVQGVSMMVIAGRPSSPSSTAPRPLLSQGEEHAQQPACAAPQQAIVTGKGGFKEELRFELLYDVARSIGYCAQEDVQDDESDADEGPAFTTRSMIAMPTADVPVDFLSAKGDDGGGGGSASRKPKAKLKSPAACRRTLVDKGNHIHSAGDLAEARRIRGSPPEDILESRANHCAPEAFRRIRHFFGISPVVYARAFPNDLNEADPHWQQKLKESVSEGASGSFFYRVMSGSSSGVPSRFIVKQITAGEKWVLTRMLPAYERHIASQKGRSLIQYLGCHSLSLRWKFSAQVHFVVMRNFLPVKMWLIFDLKGATANRRALKGKVLHNYTNSEHTTEYGTLRDWEWMDTAMGVDVDADDKAVLTDMIAADSRFLAEQGLLDYSLLVGIHRLSRDLPPAERDAEIKKLRGVGGFPSIDRQKVYFFGIIDILERYTWGWWAQRLVLTAYYSSIFQYPKADGISALAPEEYSDRFNTFMQHEVLQAEQSSQSSSHLAADDAPVGDAARRQRPRGDHRWGQLWMRRRRGLLTDRIQAERADYIRRIEELQAQVEGLRAKS